MEISSGTSVTKIIQQLQNKKLLHAYFPYTWLYRNVSLKAGEYQFSKNTAPYWVLHAISKGDVIAHNVTFAEGTNMFEMADRLQKTQLISKEDFLKACQNQTLIKNLLGESLESLEGYLYPNTYQLTKGIQAETLVTTMVTEFLKMYSDVLRSLDSKPHSRGVITSAHSVIPAKAGTQRKTKHRG